MASKYSPFSFATDWSKDGGDSTSSMLVKCVETMYRMDLPPGEPPSCHEHEECLLENEYGDFVCPVDGCQTEVGHCKASKNVRTPDELSMTRHECVLPMGHSGEHLMKDTGERLPISRARAALMTTVGKAKTRPQPDLQCTRCGGDLKSSEEFGAKMCKACSWENTHRRKSPRTR